MPTKPITRAEIQQARKDLQIYVPLYRAERVKDGITLHFANGFGARTWSPPKPKTKPKPKQPAKTRSPTRKRSQNGD